jgi:hypothetical protein
MAPPPSSQGVSMAFIEHFVQQNRPALEGLSTTEVCDRIVKPLTEASASSYADFFVDAQRSHGESPVGDAPRATVDELHASVGKATVFVSHAWGYQFLELVECLRNWWVERGSQPDVFFWLDVFVNNQHGASERPFEWWQNAFRTQVREIGHTVVVLSPWNGPKYVQRAWCLFELYTTVSSGVKYDIVLPPKQKAGLVEYLKDSYSTSTGGVLSQVCNIDIEKASAFLKSDLERILDIVSKEVGFQKLNRLIHTELQRWIVCVGREALASMTDDERVRCGLDLNVGDVLFELGRH